MTRQMVSNKWTLLILAAALVLGFVGFVTARQLRADGGGESLIHACIDDLDQVARIVSADTECEVGETPNHWSIQGPRGSAGPRGLRGFRGFRGFRGLRGPRGFRGPRGPAGIGFQRGPGGRLFVDEQITVTDADHNAIWSVGPNGSVHHVPETFHAGIILNEGDGDREVELTDRGMRVNMVDSAGNLVGHAFSDSKGFEIQDPDGNVLWSVNTEGSVHNVPETYSAGIDVLDSVLDSAPGPDPVDAIPPEVVGWMTFNPDFGHSDGPFAIPGRDNPFGWPVIDPADPGAFWAPPDLCDYIHLHGNFQGHDDFDLDPCGHGALVYITSISLGGGGIATGTLDVGGDAAVGGDVVINGKLTVAGVTDPLVAESFQVSPGESYDPGDVLVIDPSGNGVRRSYEAYDTGVIGVVAPGATVDGNGEILAVILGAHAAARDDGSRLEGYVKADASYAAIQAGDLLTTSETPGHAMVASDPRIGTILGKALEPLAEGQGLIRVFITLS